MRYALWGGFNQTRIVRYGLCTCRGLLSPRERYCRLRPLPSELGFTRVRHFKWPKSDKSDFGAGEGGSVTQQAMKGEGFASRNGLIAKGTPHPSAFASLRRIADATHRRS